MMFRELHPGFATEVVGLDIGVPLPDATIAALQDAIDAAGVLVFRGQHLDDDTQIAFARRFGQPERYVLSYRPGIKLRLAQAEMVDVSNLDAATGAPQAPDSRHRMVNLGNRLWHTDSSFRSPRGALSMLFAHAVPPEGGETEFGDCRTAFDRLPAAMKQQIETLQAEHSLMHSRFLAGGARGSAGCGASAGVGQSEDRAEIRLHRLPCVARVGHAGRRGPSSAGRLDRGRDPSRSGLPA